MAAAETRKLLEQLMGSENMTGNFNSANQLSLEDPKVCRSYIVGTCPYDLFVNTRLDVGPCDKVHNESLKNEYKELDEDRKRKLNFEWSYLQEMRKHVDECDRRIQGAQQRLEKTPDEIRRTNQIISRISELSNTINATLFEIEIMGQEGQVNMAVQEWFKVRQAMAEKEEEERKLKALSDTGGPSGHQKLQVCDVCGAYLSRLDNDRRLADHFYGKMHLGYAQMRKSYEQLSADLKGKAAPREYSKQDVNGHHGYGGGGGGYGGGHGGGGGRRRGRGGHRGGYRG